MRIADIIWRPEVIDKLAWKHGVFAEEVDQVLFGQPLFRRLQKGHVPGEHLYAAYGQTESGRYLAVFFIYKRSGEALILTAQRAIWKVVSEGPMSEDKGRIPEFSSYEEMADFWDTHSLADYWVQTEPAEFEIDPNARRRYLVAVDRELLARAQRMALARGLSTESLVNLLLEQRLTQLEATV